MPSLRLYADHLIQIYLIFKPLRVRTKYEPYEKTKNNNNKKKTIYIYIYLEL